MSVILEMKVKHINWDDMVRKNDPIFFELIAACEGKNVNKKQIRSFMMTGVWRLSFSSMPVYFHHERPSNG